MKYYAAFLILILCTGCSSLKLTNEELNPDYSTFQLKNVLVIGVTPDDNLRKEFEFKFVRLLNQHNINALQSAVVFQTYFKDAEQTEAEMEEQLELLRSKGYNTILVTLVRGVDENTSYSGESVRLDYHLRQFIGYYFMYQNAAYDNGRYEDYEVYHLQTSIYYLNSDSDMSLVWEGSYDLINSGETHKMTDKYIKKIFKSLKKEKLIEK